MRAPALLTEEKEVVNRSRNERETAVAWAGLLDHAAQYRTNLQQLIGFVETMEVRLIVALACREDMTEVIAEAKRVNEGGKEITIDNVHELLREHEESKQQKH